MAKNTQPIAKRCKALGISPTVMGYSKKETNRNPGGQMRKKKSEYALQLTEKQKVKFVYGILEKQFRSYYEKATRMSGKTGENLLILVERRLDNVVYRLGFAMTRREARQLVNHGHFTVNGQRVDIPSYLVKPGDVVEVAEKSRSSVKFKRLTGEDAVMVTPPQWLEREKNALKGTVTKLPAREDIDMPIEEHLIVELYSKYTLPSAGKRNDDTAGRRSADVRRRVTNGRNRKAAHRMHREAGRQLLWQVHCRTVGARLWHHVRQLSSPDSAVLFARHCSHQHQDCRGAA